MNIQGYGAYQAKEALKQLIYSTKSLAPYEVLVKITHCGICHSDVHLIDNDWGVSHYPFIPGHEIIGLVQEVGDLVNHLKKGQRVGIGWQASACLNCEWCLQGEENICAENQATCVGRNGGFAEHMVVDSRFAFLIPDGLTSENAAPLLCGGITVYSPLAKLNVRPSMKVGVIGIGGLGHLALQFAHAFGCEVTAFSTTASKKKEAESFGAHHFVVSTSPEQMKNAKSTVDVLLSVVTADLNWKEFIDVLRPNGKLVLLGPSPSDIPVSPWVLIGSQKSIIGNNIGGRSRIEEMLQFAERHHIEAKTEVLPLSQVNTALDKIRTNQARYRMVLKCS